MKDPKNPNRRVAVRRPWGCYKILYVRKGYKVKEIVVNPGKSLSLQSHKYRSEHWNVVSGRINILLDGRKITAKRNESVFVPKRAKHKVFNPTKKMAKVIEVQIGGYVGEDDIKRFDSYKR